MKNKEKKNKRVIKTKSAIFNAFFTLMVEKKDISKICITELTEKANINRATFYLHYKTINDVISDIQNEVVDKLNEVLEKYSINQVKENPYTLLSEISDVLESNHNFSVLLLSNNDIGFIDTIKKTFVKTMVEKELKANPNLQEKDILKCKITCIFTMSGTIDLYTKWFFTPDSLKISLEDLGNYINKLITGGLNAIQ